MKIQIIKKLLIDRIFKIVVLMKSLFGFFEIVAGIVLAISGKLAINNVIIALTKEEIATDPNDLLANYLINATSHISSSTNLFAICYLIFHGVSNLVLVIALLKNKVWAYHWALTFFTVFIVYQVYRYLHTHSALLLLLTLFDILIVLVVFLEYRNRRKTK